MVNITGTVTDIAGTPDNRSWRFTSLIRSGDSAGEVITTKVHHVRPTSGAVTVNLDPGPSIVQWQDQSWSVTVPDVDTDLWELIEAAVAFVPGTSQEILAGAVDVYLQSSFGEFAGAHLNDEGNVQFTWLGQDIGAPMNPYLYEASSIDGGSPTSAGGGEVFDGGTPDNLTTRRIIPRRGIADDWTAANPILGPGEVGYEKITGKTKIGDGNTNWNSLPYVGEELIVKSPNGTSYRITVANGGALSTVVA